VKRIHLRDVWVHLGGRPVLKGISLDLFENGQRVVALIGPSGGGKTTLLRALKGMVPFQGEIRLGDVRLDPGDPLALGRARSLTGMIYQTFQLVDRLTALENVLLGRLPRLRLLAGGLRRFPQRDVALAAHLLERVGLLEHAWKRAGTLSGGQQQRVGVARALAQEPRWILADEPISALDPKNARDVLELLLSLALEKDIPVLITLHHLDIVRHYADWVVAVKDGAVFFEGPPSGLTPELERELYFGEEHGASAESQGLVNEGGVQA
jgi:phosphonate transport system ATP-binding protein